MLLDDKEYHALRAKRSVLDWQRVWLPIPAGRHRVTWKYEPFQGRTPTAWLDEVRLRSDGRVFLQQEPVVKMQENGTISHSVPRAGTAVVWSAAGLPEGLLVNPGSGAITGTPAKRGIWNARLFVDGNSGDHDDVLMFIDASIPPMQALELPKSAWNTGVEPGAKWFGQNALTHDGTDAMRSPPTPPGSTRSLTTTMQGPVTIRWWWRIPAASAGDGCACVLDGAAVLAQVTGVNEWRQATASIPGGIHEVSWRWRTDAGGDPAAEAVILDELSIVP